jgi:tetratricopeptide (TPR) repeat protein
MNLKQFINYLTFFSGLFGVIFLPTIIIKVIAVIIVIVIFIFNNHIFEKEKEEKEETEYKINALDYRSQKQTLISKGISEHYINGLGKNPLFKQAYQFGQQYEKKGNYKDAIENYKEILDYSPVDVENIVTAYNLIGLCHFELCNFEEAMKNYQTTLNIVKKVKLIKERLNCKATIFANIGHIYQD